MSSLTIRIMSILILLATTIVMFLVLSSIISAVAPMIANSTTSLSNVTVLNPNSLTDTNFFSNLPTLMLMMLPFAMVFGFLYVIFGRTTTRHRHTPNTQENMQNQHTTLYNNSKQPEINTNQENNDEFITGYRRE